jgi:deoxycytidylate deaminase
MLVPSQPPQEMIDKAVDAAKRSHCAKSKRGAVIYDPANARLLGRGWNGQPEPLTCSGSEACRASCAKLCVHAEARAIHSALLSTHADHHLLSETVLLHAKVVDGQLVAGGGPSCWQCSREILDQDLRGVWLFLEPDHWKLYSAIDFHRETLKSNGMLL